ncbi:MAG: AAA family ATPase [Anaerostipes sp.]|uniref:AAA family ATPase n=1 Tax=Anaerostipes sp. TaxID=1872530 RepID=UPI00399AF140
MTKQPLAIGIENYKEIIEKNYYYIDKSCMIKDLIEEQGKVNLFTRPRRFGKTLALSMIRTFFEKEYDITGNLIDNTEYFAKMKIWQAKK